MCRKPFLTAKHPINYTYPRDIATLHTGQNAVIATKYRLRANGEIKPTSMISGLDQQKNHASCCWV
jgi:hypothetical protein